MSNNKRIGVLWAVILFFTPGAVWAADIAKIGVVDFQKILQISEAGKAAQAEINKQGKKMEAELKKQGDAIEEIRQRLEREALVMSQEKRDEKEREFRIKINDFKEMQKKYAADFKELEKRYITRIQKDVMDLIEEIGKKEGFLLILERRESGLMYFPSALDVTDRLIQSYNAQYSKAASAGQGDAKTPAKKKTSQ
ncbi:MAG: OmpH family outer membrane protein [Deltaproteobacteria bacterium]|nr:OmpH family outer membrane protein [Deltaproteobacteria bacterium]MBW1954805.1 OmpH family outer membrane protein [Deltaproteobacteria bacterium]MBW2042383.1 OmpH family outer membrane protein [Deltaproteobacteria bacterium]